MLTIAQITAEAGEVQNETLPSNAEISQRVHRIRSGWTVEERVQRRHDADRRFEDLIDALMSAEAA